jgi:hypothetical protein
VNNFYKCFFRFLEKATNLYSKMTMPTDEEVEDYDFRLRLEAEENGDEPEADNSDGEDGDGGDGDDEPQRPGPDEDDTKCKICYDNRAKVLTLPCRHAVMCETCAQQLEDEKCPMCRSPIENTIVLLS